MPTIHLTDTEIDEALRILKGARRYVGFGYSICRAIAASDPCCNGSANAKLRAYIMRDLGIFPTVRSKLEAYGKQGHTHDIRKLWLKQMIATLEAAKKEAA